MLSISYNKHQKGWSTFSSFKACKAAQLKYIALYADADN